MLGIIVCVKQVFDPEAPSSAYAVDSDKKCVLPPKGSPPVLSPYDENALEAALKIKDSRKARIAVLSLGSNPSKSVLRKTLAAGADELTIIEDEDHHLRDSRSTGRVLAAAIDKMGEFDLILCGRQSSDTNNGQVGPGIAEILNLPCISLARKLDLRTDRLIVERELPDGYEIIESPLPAVVTVGSEVGELRLATVKAMMSARKKAIAVLRATDLGNNASLPDSTEVVDIFMAPDRGSVCEYIEAEPPDAAGDRLARKLRELRVI
ncbi:MAG: electron transfer flavoprotein subunit beta/FixA family protein [Proteobacteria bacterium]|nr:electron transfer flavoprotein subunit beta/FixA family protein [Pseudomonadota bacterium]